MTKVLIIGATSAIAHETAKCFAKEGAHLFLVARSAEKLAIVADDLTVWGAKSIETVVQDLNELELHEQLLEQATSALDGIDILLIAHGTLGNQQKCQLSVAETMRELNTNALSVISLLTIAANYFEQQRHGTIAVISSVAGDRGRKSNYVYGTAKAAVTAFLQGLRNRLSSSGVTVLTIKPGFVATPMTAAVKQGALFASSATVGKGIYTAIQKHKDVVYLPAFWRLIMLVVKVIPEALFKRLSL